MSETNTSTKPHTGAKLTPAARTGSTVSVGNKLPYTMILRLHDFHEASEPVMGGGSRTVRTAHQIGESVVIRGSGHPVNKAADIQIVGGYALTHGVDKDFFERWLSQNSDLDTVTKGLIFARNNHSDVEAGAREQAGLRTGLEAGNPKNLANRLDVVTA